MEWAEGKILEQTLKEEFGPINEKINWIIKAMMDNKLIPKETKNE